MYVCLYVCIEWYPAYHTLTHPDDNSTTNGNCIMVLAIESCLTMNNHKQSTSSMAATPTETTHGHTPQWQQ